MERLQVAEWLMMSRIYDQQQNGRCESCASCTVCNKNRYPPGLSVLKYPDLNPPRLLRVVPEEIPQRRTQIFTPNKSFTTLSEERLTAERSLLKRRRYEDDVFYERKRFCPPYLEKQTTNTSPPLTPPLSPPSPSQMRRMPPKTMSRSFDSVSNSDEEEKVLDKEFHKKEVERAKYERTIKLYKFLIDLLEEKNPCVVWVTRETGIFKIKDSEQLAKLWGEVKLNPTMNYEKLARSFRHYYKKGILDSGTTLSKCGKRKLYYKFSAAMLKKYLDI